MLENTEGPIKNGQSRETVSIGYTRRGKAKQKHNTVCLGHHYTQTNTNNVDKTCVLLHTFVHWLKRAFYKKRKNR